MKNSNKMVILLMIAAALAVCGLVKADESAQGEQRENVDVLAIRITEAREAVGNYNDKKNEMDELISLGKALYLGGVQRPKEPWLKESFDVWDEILERYPQEPLVMAYAGSVRVLQARDAFFPWTKGKLLKQGQRLLVDARKQSPGNMQVIWLQAVTAYHLPEKFKQRETAWKNFTILAKALQASQESQAAEGEDAAGQLAAGQHAQDDRQALAMINNLEPAMKASVWYYQGLSLDINSDLTAAMTAWRRAVKAQPESAAAKAAAACLLKHSSDAMSHDKTE